MSKTNTEETEKRKIVQGLVGCRCINEELALILEELISRAIANAQNHIEEPYGESIEGYKKKLNRLEAAEDALKSLDLCDKEK